VGRCIAIREARVNGTKKGHLLRFLYSDGQYPKGLKRCFETRGEARSPRPDHSFQGGIKSWEH